MFPHGIIYEAGRSEASGEFRLRPSLAKKISFHLLRGFGAGLIAFAIVGIIFSFWPIVSQEFLYRFGTSDQVEINKFAQIIGKSRASELGLDPYFSLYIPKINAKAKVIPNVNPGKATDYLKALSEGVAHAQGTNFPGQGKTVYLFSHSTDSPINIAQYNAVFYLLRKLEKGDRIVVYFLDQEHDYVVTDKFVTAANDTSWLKDDGSGERLILQTCDPPGTSWNRLLVIARPI
ncbi:MAG TPA: sortase [Patescibacteria group bacterium]|nr:sortase [Patescibacteria group bacterium]